ncbi:magnesium-translocating P-type ATPase [Shinella zoogloeoides]|uniref:magnesium-translocating P-type ATPase n=1 Tax=Shinella zoogloeoides TaxID=352475 RepID=UPI000E65C0F5|nr:magnesium-translocating P-type ATPase [Shinella zoogloeoides]
MQPETSPSQAVDSVPAYWSISAEALLARLDTRTSGLSSEAARNRLNRIGANTIRAGQGGSALAAFARQFRSPLVLILIFAAIVSGVVGEGSEAVIIGVIVLASCVLSFSQEYGASRAMQALTARIARKALVLRDGRETLLPVEEIVPGDIVRLSAGNLIPADGILLETRDFNVSEAALTGETFPVIKTAGICPPEARLGQRTNTAFTGTSVRSGTAKMVVVKTGGATEFASIAATIAHVAPETDFARGIRRFGYLMTEIMLVIVILVFFANLLLHRPAVDSLLFSLALAVGLTPELLPAIISVTLARGARTMAANGVIVRRLDAIENLGSMDLLCTDKTGTLTEGVIHLDACLDVAGTDAPQVRLWALLNATLQTGMANPLDEAIASGKGARDDIAAYAKVDEIPYDFIRKRLSVVVRRAEEPEDLMICKGAVQTVVGACSFVLAEDGAPVPLDAAAAAAIDGRVQAWSGKGYRVLGLAVRRFARQDSYRREDEADLALAGFLLFFDPPKTGMAETLKALASRGIKVKIITGDNRYVAAHLAETVGLPHRRVLTGTEVSRLTKEALVRRVSQNDIFAEIDPNQKERIIAALRKHGHVVGYLGDGINDAPALHEADVGISVEGAVDVAREAADMILLQRDLGVLLRGIDDGRKTFANTMKYISITTSANFGNMVSMAFASLALPFLPLLAPQILLNNFLADMPSLAIATDNVDLDQVRTPRRWDIAFVRRFMVTFGLVSSLFDLVTFAFLLLVAGATASVFQTGWFVESLVTQLAIVLVVRTHVAFWRSRPSALLSSLTLAVAVFAIAIPYLPGADWFGFVALPLPVVGGLIAITLAYLAVSETAKHWFFARERHRRQVRRRV